MQLQRLVLDYRGGDLVVRCLYRSKGGAGPGTKTRQREVSELAREGLTQALEALEVGAECGARVRDRRRPHWLASSRHATSKGGEGATVGREMCRDQAG